MVPNVKLFFLLLQGDLFSGLNDGLLSRAEALAAVDRNQNSHAAHQQMTQQLKHDVMYHHGMGGPPQRPLQVREQQTAKITFIYIVPLIYGYSAHIC